MLRIGSKRAAGREEGLEKLEKRSPDEVRGSGEAALVVVGGGVEGIGEGGGDGMAWVSGVAGFGEGSVQ